MNPDWTLVIIPTYNERENLPDLVRRIFETVPEAHVLVVDDKSPDGTADMAESLFFADTRFHLLRREGPRGLGRSYVDGYLKAIEERFQYVVQMDADHSHDPAYLPTVLEAMKQADVVIGSRYCPDGGVENWPVHRLMLSRFSNLYVRMIAGVTPRDSTSGFRCYSRAALKQIQVDRIVSDGYAFQVEMTYRAARAGLEIAEVPIVFTDRKAGKSKISRRVILESMLLPWKLRFSRRYRNSAAVSHSTGDYSADSASLQ